MLDTIELSHGDGSAQTGALIQDIFLKQYGNSLLNPAEDSFVFSQCGSKLAYSTDSFVVKPLFFRGGNIGKLSVCGTINDLVTAGAFPLYMAVGWIIEEGFPIQILTEIAKSMAVVCREAGVRIVTGDTKVVEKGSADGLFINTSGIGAVSPHYAPSNIAPGDAVLITGPIAEHGTAILLDRYSVDIQAKILSDCQPLQDLLTCLGTDLQYIKKMKDPTRGGLATIANEIAVHIGYDIELFETEIPITKPVQAVLSILGIDPLYLACEGRMLLIVEQGQEETILQRLKQSHSYQAAKIIGRVTEANQGVAYLHTKIGGKRFLSPFQIQSIPRIC